MTIAFILFVWFTGVLIYTGRPDAVAASQACLQSRENGV